MNPPRAQHNGAAHPEPQPIAILEPDATGVWQITTETGTRYVLDLPPDGAAHVSRIPSPTDVGDGVHRGLEGVLLISWECHRATIGADPAVLLGDRLVLVMEPLSPGAELSIRITSAVTRIEQLQPSRRPPE
jgi:hypothetical protein